MHRIAWTIALLHDSINGFKNGIGKSVNGRELI